MLDRVAWIASACLLSVGLLGPSVLAQGYPYFESPQAHPIAISADGQRLYAVNTPDHRLAVYSLALPTAPVLIREIPVGLEPVSVAVRSQNEVWVVNHVSDSVSVVDVSRGIVVDTVRVRDEPGDIVFAGDPQRAFVSSMTKRRVVVIDPMTRSTTSIHVFGDDPRALLASADGKTVWVAITRSGNKTTIVPHTMAPPPPKPTNPALPPAPQQGIIVDADDPAWKSKLNVKLPDYDVVEIDTMTLSVRRNYSGVGTNLFNLALRPGSDEIWVANTHSRNRVRFEPVIRAHATDSQVTRITTGSNPTVTPVNLNPGIDYSKLPNPVALSSALAQPTDIVFDATGKVAYVAAFGTDRIGVIDASGKVTALIEVGDTPGTKVAPRTKRGPRGLALHPSKPVLYVLNRLSNSISLVDTAQNRVVSEIGMFDPTPKQIREGRGFLFDAKLSGAGTMSCASCHIDARTDGLAWDLGDPGGQMFSNGTPNKLHPMKGALLTQTLQGFKGERIFHWRADRPGLATFNSAFDGLMGGQLLNAADLATFVAYMQDISFMPNPNRQMDDTLSNDPVGASARDGEVLFNTRDNVGREGNLQFKCVGCHTNVSGSGSFGFTGLIGQQTKVAQLRGLYKRTGRAISASGRTAGFGFGADGSKDDLTGFLSSTSRFTAQLTANEKKAIERFLLAFPTGNAPAVGYSRTVTAANIGSIDVTNDLTLLMSQADAGKCDLVVKGSLRGQPVGLSYDRLTKRFLRDRKTSPAMAITELAVEVVRKGAVLTFMGAPLGTGRQLGIDRDGNGILDGDEGILRYGDPTPVCATVLRTEANQRPRIGEKSFALIIAGSPARSSGWLSLSRKRTNARVVDLDLLIDLAAGVTFSVRADSRGEAIVSLPLPDTSKLVGARLRAQGIMLAPCGRLKAAASAGLELTPRR